MTFLALLLMSPAADPTDAVAKKMQPVYLGEARDYAIAVAAAPKKPLAVKPEPVFEWSNPTRNGGQQGVVFVWLRDGRPAAAGCIFSSPDGTLSGARRIEHEFHALDAEQLVVTRDSFNQWKPEEGLARQELPDAPAPADAPAARKLRMGRLAERFTGHTVDAARKERFEVADRQLGPGSPAVARAAAAPLRPGERQERGPEAAGRRPLRVRPGTDPEVVLVLEAVGSADKAEWQCAFVRATHGGLEVKRGDEVVWTAKRHPDNRDPKLPHFSARRVLEK